ncbi:hypothetical protein AAG656_28640 [Streptomyces albidoflavus]|uniref:hypothetical protein n=1 Tax=Streptomyces albidoflavus TaxID=1886 RepID=UPI00315ACBD6
MKMPPSDALLDSPSVRDQFTWAGEILGAGEQQMFTWIVDGPLPEAAKLVHGLAAAADLESYVADDARRIANARALAKVVFTSGRAFARTEATAPATDWRDLLQFAREEVAKRGILPANQPWVEAAGYALDRCEQVMAGEGPEPTRGGTYGVLRHIATVASAHRLPREWKLDIETELD